MASFGDWIKELPPVHAALGALILVGISGFLIGAGAAQFASSVRDIPARVTTIEDRVITMDSLSLSWRSNTESVLNGMGEDLRAFFVQDSIQKWATNCIIRRLVEGEPINRYDCVPPSGDPKQ